MPHGLERFVVPATYGIGVVLWAVVLGVLLARLRRPPDVNRLFFVLVVVLSIDAFRTLFENAYFGAYWNAVYGVLPSDMKVLLEAPSLVVLPRLVNLLAGGLILFLIVWRWLPAAETETTLIIRGLLDDNATAAMSIAMGSSAEVSSAAHLPERMASRVFDGKLGSDPATLLRVEGFGPSVAYRLGQLRQMLGNAGPLEELTEDASRALWRDVRDVCPFADGSDKPVWRISMPPANAHHMVLALRMQAACDAFYDWQGGLVWLRMEGEPEADLLRGLIRQFGGGHATLVRAAPAWRAAIPVFEPQPAALAALSARLKAEFDPKSILNPGRMVHSPDSATLTRVSEGATS